VPSLGCHVKTFYSAVTLVRCIRAVRSVSITSNVWTLISSAPLSIAALRHTQRRVPISSLNVASQSAIFASCDLAVPACQIWRTFDKINTGQWTVMHHTVSNIRSRKQKQLPVNYSTRITWYWTDIHCSEATLDTAPRDTDISGAREKHASENTVYAYIDMYVV
jgi:hypothetical protein